MQDLRVELIENRQASIQRALLLALLFCAALPAATKDHPLTVTPGLDSLEWVVTNSGEPTPGQPSRATATAASGISINDAIANTTVFNSNTSIDSSIRLDDLSEDQRLEIFNRDFAATINAAAVEDDTTFIEEFIGCSLGSRKTNDPIFPLLVLPAMAGLALKRCQNASRHLV